MDELRGVLWRGPCPARPVTTAASARSYVNTDSSVGGGAFSCSAGSPCPLAHRFRSPPTAPVQDSFRPPPECPLGGISDWQPAHAHAVPQPDATPARPKQRHPFGVVSSRFLSSLSRPIGIRPPSPLHPPGRSTLSVSESAAQPIGGAAPLQFSDLPGPRHLTSGQYSSAALGHPFGVDSSAFLSDSGCSLASPIEC
jgi:hypothetical protein